MMKAAIENLSSRLAISYQTKATFYLRAFGLAKIPLLFLVSPRVQLLSDEEGCEVIIPFRKITKNHLGSMYFGALCIGADCAGGLLGMHFMKKTGHDFSFAFKDFKAEFLKRPEGDVLLTCRDTAPIKNLVDEAVKTGERVHAPLKITATVPKLLGDEPVAQFVLTLSIKKKK